MRLPIIVNILYLQNGYVCDLFFFTNRHPDLAGLNLIRAHIAVSSMTLSTNLACIFVVVEVVKSSMYIFVIYLAWRLSDFCLCLWCSGLSSSCLYQWNKLNVTITKIMDMVHPVLMMVVRHRLLTSDGSFLGKISGTWQCSMAAKMFPTLPIIW